MIIELQIMASLSKITANTNNNKMAVRMRDTSIEVNGWNSERHKQEICLDNKTADCDKIIYIYEGIEAQHRLTRRLLSQHLMEHKTCIK